MINISFSNFLIAMPEIYLVFMAFILIFFSFFQSRQDDSAKIIFFNNFFYLTLLILLLALALVCTTGNTYVSSFNSLFIISPIIYSFKIIIIVLAILLILIIKPTLIDIGLGYNCEYLVVYLFAITANLLLLSSNDFMSVYVSIEALSIATYILIFMYKDQQDNLEAGIKYFLLSALGTGFMLYGISFIYGFSGSTNFIEIKKALMVQSNNWLVVLSVVGIIVGFGFKLSLAPFHMWTSDVYKGVYTPITLFLAVITKVAIMILFIRILWEPFFGIYKYWYNIVYFLILASAVVGYIIAITQSNLKRFLAYSSIANMSYVLLASLNISSNSINHIIIYFITYMLALIGFIAVIMLIKKNNQYVEDVADLNGLHKKYPYLAFAITIFSLSLAGIPITAGFFGKFLILYSAFASNTYLLPIVILLLTVVIMYYYFNIIKAVYINKYTVDNLSYAVKNNIGVLTLIGLLIFIILTFVVWLNPLNTLLDTINIIL